MDMLLITVSHAFCARGICLQAGQGHTLLTQTATETHPVPP